VAREGWLLPKGVRVESPEDPNIEEANWQEFRRQSLSQLLEKHNFDQLVKLYSLEELEKRFGIDEIIAQFPEVKEDTDGVAPGVLSPREIKQYVKNFRLICPFEEGHLKGASYYLSLGDEYALQGKKGKLQNEAGKDEVTIPPFQVAIIKTKEIINMPRFLIGRWNIRVTQAYQGLLWVGGPQVDPVWVGHLFCPIYNLSDEDVTLKKGERIATMDFVRTTDFDPDFENGYKDFRKNVKKTIDEYNWRLRSGLYTMAQKRIDDIEKKISSVENLSIISLAVIAVLFTLFGILVTSIEKLEVSPPIWAYVSVGLAVVALLVSLIVWTRARTRAGHSKWFVILVLTYVVLSAVAIGFLATKVW
jgi:deoxycytidine triphosphate deaminase